MDEYNVRTETYTAVPKLTMAASSIIGTRKYQQDSYACIETPSGCLAVVCDGMGGLEGGEKASSLVVRNLLEDYIRLTDGDIRRFLKVGAIKLDKKVFHIAGDNGEALGAGTTLAAVHVLDGRMSWVSVGDSKIYVLRSGELHCIVREHNYRLLLNEMLSNGKLTKEQYHAEEGQAEALISYLGIGELSLMDTDEKPLQLLAGDMVILCSDGLYKSLSEDKIKAVIADNDFDLQRAANELTATALRTAARGQDNTTVILLRYS